MFLRPDPALLVNYYEPVMVLWFLYDQSMSLRGRPEKIWAGCEGAGARRVGLRLGRTQGPAGGTGLARP